MLAGDFQAAIKKLNKNLHIFCGDDDSKPAGLWYRTKDGQYEEICGVDKNYIDEHMRYNPISGRISHGGWRRVLKLLIEKGLADKRKAEKVFRTTLDCFETFKYEKDPITRELEEAKRLGELESIRKADKPVENYYRYQDLIEIHRHRNQLKGLR